MLLVSSSFCNFLKGYPFKFTAMLVQQKGNTNIAAACEILRNKPAAQAAGADPSDEAPPMGKI